MQCAELSWRRWSYAAILLPITTLGPFWSHARAVKSHQFGNTMFDKKDSTKSPRDTNGPVVKTGPTSGSNRSRNNDGSWRKKRSDTGGSKKKTGCFISTAACQHKGLSDECKELEILRSFRDGYLMNSPEGSAMVEHYYSIAPAITERLVDPVELEQVWEVIRYCVKAIESGRCEDAKSKYCTMVLSLERKYLYYSA